MNPKACSSKLLVLTPIAPGATQTVNHGLCNLQGGILPDFIMPDRDTPIAVQSVNLASIVFVNNGLEMASASFLVQQTISMQRAQGQIADDNSTPSRLWWKGQTATNGTAFPSQLLARTVGTANIDVQAHGLAAINGVTPVAGDLVWLANQTVASQNGMWVAAVGAWTRPAFWVTGNVSVGLSCVIYDPACVDSGSGVSWAGSAWRITSSSAAVGSHIIVDTDTVVTYPKNYTLQGLTDSPSAGLWTVSNIWLLSRTTSAIIPYYNILKAGTTVALSVPFASRVAGPPVTGAFVINGTAADATSVVDVEVVNF